MWLRRASVSGTWGMLLVAGLMLGACGDEGKRRLGGTCSDDADCATGVCGGGVCLDPAADEDRDGLQNGLEVDLGTNPLDGDTDADGTADREELDQGLANLDVDGDGTPDALESATEDSDGDCIPNQFDAQNAVPDAELAALVAIVCKDDGVCASGASSLTVVCETGADGLKKARCDYAAVPAYEAEETLCDSQDNDCDGATDEGGSDADEDGQADCVDADDDGDGVSDDDDVCPLVADAGQGDVDGDGAGDACDVPLPPVVSGSEPASPASDPTPRLIGIADANTQVEAFAGTRCEGGASGSGNAGSDGAFALEVAADANAETRFVLRSTNPAGLASVCIPSAFAYRHDDIAPAAPVLVAISPPPPSPDPSPRVSGRAEPAARVALYADAGCDGGALGEGVADAGGDFAITVEVPQSRETILYAVAADAAGNASACTLLGAYLHDDTPPPPPAAHPIPFVPASPSPDLSPLVQGCAASGATVELFTSAGCQGTATTLTADRSDDACDSGSAFALEAAAISNGALGFHARVRSDSGLTSACIPLGTYLHDDTPPAVPTFLEAIPPSPSGQTRPAIRGTSDEAFASVTLHGGASCDGATLIGRGTTASDGTFEAVVSVTASATTTIYAQASDLAGNASACAVLTSYTHDASVPAAPGAHPTPFVPASPSNADDTPTLRGCATAGAPVDVFTSDGCSGEPLASFTTQATAGGCPAGSFLFSGDVGVATPASTTTFRGQTRNALGVRSACATLGTFVYDAVAPAPPLFDAFVPASPSASRTPLVSGSAEPGATVTLYHGDDCVLGVAIGETSADAAGDWAIPGELEGLNGTTRFHAVASDAAGNESSCAALGSYLHDDSAPAAPSAHPNAPFTPASPSRTDFTPTLAGCASQGAAVAIYTNDGCSGAPVVTLTASRADLACASGFAFSGDVSVARPSSTTTYRGQITSNTGVRSTCATLGTFVFDAVVPAPPALSAIVPASPSRVPTPVATGTAEAYATVSLFTSAGCAGVVADSIATGQSGEWTLVAALTALNTSAELSAYAADVAGNISSCAALGSYVHDDIAPPAPLVLAAQALPQPSNDTTPNVRFCAESGSAVTVFTASDCSGSGLLATATAAGTCGGQSGRTQEQEIAPTVSGAASWYASARDAAGNSSPCALLTSYQVDTSPPAAPSLLRIKGKSWTMLDANTVNTVDFEVAGASEPGATIAFFVDGAAKGTVVADGAGNFIGTVSGVASAPVSSGPRKLTARATDQAGNPGGLTLERTIVGPVTLNAKNGAAAAEGVWVGLGFPDGTLFRNGTTDVNGVYNHRSFAGMMVTVAHQHPTGPNNSKVRRVLQTWMDLMPLDVIPVDVTPPPPGNAPLSTVDVALPAGAPTGATTLYKAMATCNAQATGTAPGATLSLEVRCRGVGETVDVLAVAYEDDPFPPFERKKAVAYARGQATLVSGGPTSVSLGPWILATAPASTLVTSSITIHNDIETLVPVLLQSQVVGDGLLNDFTISQLADDDQGGLNFGVALNPGESDTVSIPFITEIGPWRYLLGALVFLGFGEGMIASTYEFSQGEGAPPASFGTRELRGDLLPLISPDLLLDPGADLDRPRYGWVVLSSMQRADTATFSFDGEGNCTGVCNGTSNQCASDADCVQGLPCINIFDCDELQWNVAWQPWDADTSVQLPVLPGNLAQRAEWLPSNQDRFRLRNVGFMDADYLDGWQETKLLGGVAFIFASEGGPPGEPPTDATVHLTFMGDN